MTQTTSNMGHVSRRTWSRLDGDVDGTQHRLPRLILCVAAATMIAVFAGVSLAMVVLITGFGETFAWLMLMTTVGLLLILVLNWWYTAAPHIVWTDDKTLACASIARKCVIPWREVIQAAVIERRSAEWDKRRQRLCITTRWQTCVISLQRILPAGLNQHERQRRMDDLLDTVQTHLEANGVHLDRNLAETHYTVVPLLPQILFWPHRRLLAYRFEQLNAATGRDLVDHHKPVPSLKLSRHCRPLPTWAALPMLAVLTVGAAVSGGGLEMIGMLGLGAAGVLCFNTIAQRLTDTVGPLRPETMTGSRQFSAEELSRPLAPAPGCVIDFEARYIERPDKKRWRFDELAAVSLGPEPRPHDAHRVTRPPSAWQMAIHTSDATRFEIYTNVNLDMIWHGDLDTGYPLFNWVAARELALAANADLTLVTGTTSHKRLKETLIERLDADLTRYDPQRQRDALNRAQTASRVWLDLKDETLRVWGPLVKQPIQDAAPPIWKPVLIAAGLLAMGAGVSVVAPFVGYLSTVMVHDLITARQFQAPGFTLDRTGVWVRGVAISWEELNATTLMPVSSGPIVFAGSERVLVAGHPGNTYHERAWLGCAVYDWISRQKHLLV